MALFTKRSEVKRKSLPLVYLIKYNPKYILLTMNHSGETTKLRTMESKNLKGKKVLSTDTRGGFFEIHVKGHLDESWTDWLEGLEIELLQNGEMVLSGYIEDQAALMGILNKLYNLNLTLLTISKVEQKK